MNETQIGRLLDYLLSIDKSLKRVCYLLEAVSSVEDHDGKGYGHLDVEVHNTVKIEGDVTAYDPR